MTPPDEIDPYAWMHDSSSPEFLAYLAAERAAYESSVAHLAPLVSQLHAEAIGRMPNSIRYADIRRMRSSYYTEYLTGRDYPRLVRRPTDSEDPEILIDFAELAVDSDYFDWAYAEVSPDENLLAYAVDGTGDEVFALRFRDLRTGADLDEEVPSCYYGAAWSADSRDLFYTVPDLQTYRPYQLWRHRVGTPIDQDVLLYEETDAAFELNVRACRTGDVVAWSTSHTTTECWWLDRAGDDALRSLGGRRHGVRYTVEARQWPGLPSGRDWLIVTDEEALEGRLVSAPFPNDCDLDHTSWHEVRRHRPTQRLYSVDAFAHGVVASIREAGQHRLLVLPHDDLDTDTCQVVTSRHVGSDVYISETPRYNAPAFAVLDEARTEPAHVRDVDFTTAAETVVWTEEAPGYDPTRYVTSVLQFPSSNGTLVSATVIRHRDTPLDGTAPCLMYGYGAYEVVFEPEWAPALPGLLDRGVVYVYTHLRGGGEGGRAWALDGKMAAKQHTFDDHIAVADGLAAQRLVDGNRIATRGLSAGGLLQGAVFAQRPDRWAAVVAEVPFVDVITSMSDPDTPLTISEWEEWGDPRIPEQRAWLSAYDPMRNLPPAGGRPPLLVTGALHDARVMVREPAKWVAALKATDPEWAPQCVFRAETGPGAHSGPSGRFGHLRYEAEVYAWVLAQLGLADGASS